MNWHFIAVRDSFVNIRQVYKVSFIFIYLLQFCPSLQRHWCSALNTHHFLEFNSFYTVYISESRKALKCFWKKNSATKRLLCSDGSFRRRRKSQPEAARPTSIRRLDLQAFRIHAPDRKTLRPRAPPVPCHESPDSESAPAWPQSPGTHLLCLQHRPDSIKDWRPTLTVLSLETLTFLQYI